ncbi:MAG TPA: bifunctional (p)ppGpp synthetase/guanosine-3',5'-bis(diphosphate) 3'-pyrophosphohydrolase [Anaeromyxobacteraceae bacterium]|nr:bifunctional (p)ppGpp synthetase/guanosine-3',5'-bis(diphosphate) 3'-pyrophosphohydrolase [Anaeromyxobacteraceae bacterium]
MLRLNDILDRVASYHPDPDLDLIKKAYVYSAKVHQGQIRKSGEPYLVHPLEVAGILAELKLDESSVVTGLLHDTIEDTLATKDEIAELFGREISELVDGVTKLSQFSAANTQEEKQAENFRKMVVAMAKDIRVLLVKLADRTHNMRTLDAMKAESQERIARETIDIYAPLANRLGIQWIKTELEDLSFRYLKPQDWADLSEKVAVRAREKEKFVAEVVEIIRTRLAEANVEADVSGRVKHVYSVWRKMRQLDVDFDQIQDVIAFRVIVKTVAQCYESLGTIHSLWKPVPGRFKDYIAIPKPNLYQSLHTTVVGPKGERIEVQIRTEEMHRIAEEGVAAHWAYKEKGRDGKGGGEMSAKDVKEFSWLRQLVEFQQDVSDPREFLETVKVDLFSDEVFVFTPKGDVKSLPRGATPVDFAYSVHSEVGAHTVGAKVNGKLVPLRYKLKNGDTVEILTSTHSHPSKDWLTFVRTSRAQARIRQFIRQAEHQRSIEIGREIFDREARRFGLTLTKLQKGGELEKAANVLGYRIGDDAIAAIGYGKVTPLDLLKNIVPEEKLAQAQPPEPQVPSRLSDLFRKVAGRPAQGGGVRISGIEDVLVRYGKCCNPLPGDPIVGFITRGRGVTVHTAGCDKILGLDRERRVDVSWDVKGDFKRPVSLRVVSADRPGLLAQISQRFGEAGVNISQATVRTNDDRAVIDCEVTIGDLKQLKAIIRSIEGIDGVHSVQRVQEGGA